jgi:hypothetical protein
MARKRYKPEEIEGKQRQADMLAKPGDIDGGCDVPVGWQSPN